MRSAVRLVFSAAAGVLLAAPWSGATTLLQMNLEQMTGRADRVFRGTVLSAREGSVQAGGGQLPTITYRIRVDEAFKGSYPESKGDQSIVELQMLAEPKSAAKDGVKRVSIMRDLPRLEVGRDYLLFATPASAIGLSTTVGLGQGLFGIRGAGKEASAVNAFGNVGLFRGMQQPSGAQAERLNRGPIAYADLASQIRSLVGR